MPLQESSAFFGQLYLRALGATHRLLRRFGQRIERQVGAFAAQPEIAERPFVDARRQLEAIDQVRRSQHAIARLAAEFLDAGAQRAGCVMMGQL